MDPSNLNCSVQELLAKQLILVQQALAFNEAIAKRLELEGKGESANSPVPAARGTAATLQVPAAQPASTRGKSDLSEPLLKPAAQQLLVVPADVERKGSTDSVEGQSGGLRPSKRPGPAQLFPNVEDLKGRVLQQLSKPEYHVEDFYSKTGVFQRIATSKLFQNVALAVIALNSLWIAYETDNNKADVLCNAPMQFQVVDNLFCIFFVFEITVRLLAFSNRCDAFKDGWWVFDFSLVALMVWETWIQVIVYKIVSAGADGTPQEARSGSHTHLTFLRIFRILRLTRVARMVRLMRQVPELVILIKGIAMATRSVSATLTLLLAIVYVFAVLFTQLLSGNPASAGCFDTVPQAMICLLHEGVFTEQAEFMNKLADVDWAYYAFMLVYLVLASLTVLNMLIGVLCEVVSVVAQVEREEMLVKDLQRQIGDLMRSIDPRENKTVSKEKFALLMTQVEATRMLHEVGVDVVALIQFGDFIFREQEELPLGEFLATVLQFRGTNTATVKDVVDLRKFVSSEIVAMEQRMGKRGKRA